VQSFREGLADVLGLEVAQARAEVQRALAVVLAETRATNAELRGEVATLKAEIKTLLAGVRNGEKGETGAAGKDGAQGEKGNDGRDGADGAPGRFPIPCRWASGIHYQSAVVIHDGSTWIAQRDTAQAPPHDDWLPLAVRGNDAPVGEVRGLYDPAVTYRKFDMVSKDGAEFRAKCDNPGPLPGSDDWMQSARQGKPGKPGPRGEAGAEGKQGPPGKSPRWTARGFKLIDATSGDEIDLRPLFERYHADAS